MLWAARGRPDDVPELPGNLIAPGAEAGIELYDIACAGCHGRNGEGLFGISLAERGISQAAARSFIRDGIPELGMPAFEGQFTPEQLQTLSEFVAEMSEGAVPREEYPLSAPENNCSTGTTPCGGE
jgi:mono/diheme cytochrome c family protein